MPAKILILTNDEIMMKALRISLQRHGYYVDSMALQNRTTNRLPVQWHIDFYFLGYNFVILDLSRAGDTGRDISENVRRYDGKVPILVLTPKAGMEKEGAEFQNRMGVQYLFKPFSLKDLLQEIETKRSLPSGSN